VRCFAPAKLNLALDLGPPRGDGYHAIRTVMQAVSLGDRLFVTPAPAFALTDPDVDGPDLVERAARLFTDATGVAARVRVEVRKRIPLGAGLGGGSSDAAATLRALRELLLPTLPWPDLLAMARGLGSDVAFFLGESPLALCEGRGEILTALPPRAERYAVIAWPGVQLSTASVYARSAPGPGGAADEVVRGADTARNDLEAAALAACPELARMCREAREHGLRLKVTGSGSAAYALYRDPGAALAALRSLERFAPRTAMCRTLAAWPRQVPRDAVAPGAGAPA